MLGYERQQQILELLNEERFVTVSFLCNKLYTSGATIRRDLTEMDQKGLLRRVRGGATCIQGSSEDAPLLLRTKTEIEKKQKIALLALQYIQEGDSLFFDSSSTVSTLAEHLSDFHNLTVVTNGFTTASILNDMPRHKVFLCGGRLLKQSSMIGPMAEDAIRKFSANKVFFSCCGLSIQSGITEANEENATIKRLMLNNSTKRILLCDSTKFDTTYFCKTCDLAEIDVLITDCLPNLEFLKYLNKLDHKVQVIYPLM
ncbi:MAG: DeoR/GlpR family DNA-binding transcription regulator [bacterium]|nr:DeoR/GlpR family DNA-binding transcription regulator [bacterium]